MNIINIMIKEIKQNIRDRKAMIMMILFPIVIITILGTALSDMFAGRNVFKDTRVLYTVTGNNEEAKAFKSLIDKSKDLDITFIKAKDKNEGINSVKSNKKASAYINIDEKSNSIKLYKNDRFNFNASYVESILNTFIGKYNLAFEIAKVNPSALKSLNDNSKPNFTNVVSLTVQKKQKAIDYYAVTMLTLIIMYGAMSSSSSVINERTMKTGTRILTTPAKKTEVLFGRVLGNFLITVAQVSVVFLFSRYVLKTNWGDATNIPGILAVLFSEVFMAVSLGIGVAFIVKSEYVNSVISSIIPVIVLLGGCYFPLEQFNSKLLNVLSNISPLKWINDAIFQAIYNNNLSVIPKAVLISLTAGIIFIVTSSLLYRKEAI